jgi:Thermopsin
MSFSIARSPRAKQSDQLLMARRLGHNQGMPKGAGPLRVSEGRARPNRRTPDRVGVALALTFCLLSLTLSPNTRPWPGIREPSTSPGLASPLDKDPGRFLRTGDAGPHLRVNPVEIGVNPLRGGSQGPAPMGLADYGVNSSLVPYSYNTTLFEGVASIQKLSAESPSGPELSFQLNAYLRLNETASSNSSSLNYWIQNALEIRIGTGAGGDGYYPELNVWNASAANSTLNAASIEGNGSFVPSQSSGLVFDSCAEGCEYRSGLHLPGNLSLRLESFELNGVPTLGFDYSIGVRWIRYDTVSFPEAGRMHLRDWGFYVSGATYNAWNLFEDVEWVYGGPEGGQTATDTGSLVNFTLLFWNGHNLQAPQATWNFGSDSGESVSNVTVVGSTSAGGIPDCRLTGGAGSLAIAYDTSEVGSLTVDPPASSGEIDVSGYGMQFVGGLANLTLVPGNYSVQLENSTVPPVSISLSANEVFYLDLRPGSRVNFLEIGLPPGTDWGISIDGFYNSTTGSDLSFFLPNATYAVNYSSVPGYDRAATDPGQVSLPQTGSVLVYWSPFLFSLPIAQSGLPSGTYWSIVIGSEVASGNGTELFVSVGNGSSPFVVRAPYEFLANPGEGTLNVTAGHAPLEYIEFSFRPTFVEGTIVPVDANLTIGGLNPEEVNGRFNDSVIPGTYEIVASALGYVPLQLTVEATAGNVTSVEIVLSRAPATVAIPQSAASLETLALLALGLGVATVVGSLALVARGRREKG